MTLKNKLYNWWYKVKKIKTKGFINAGEREIRQETAIVKYDWSKPTSFFIKGFERTKKGG